MELSSRIRKSCCHIQHFGSSRYSPLSTALILSSDASVCSLNGNRSLRIPGVCCMFDKLRKIISLVFSALSLAVSEWFLVEDAVFGPSSLHRCTGKHQDLKSNFVLYVASIRRRGNASLIVTLLNRQ